MSARAMNELLDTVVTLCVIN